MHKKLKIAVFHNLPAGGAIKALYDNIDFLKKHGHHVDVYTTEFSNKSFAPLDELADNHYVYQIKRSKFRKFLIKPLDKILPYSHFDKDSKIFIKFSDYKSTLKNMAKDIDDKNYDLVLLEQDILFSLSSPILKYITSLKVYYCQQPSRYHEKILLKFKPEKPFYTKLVDKLYEEKYANLDSEYAQYADYILCNSYFSHENILRSYGVNARVSYLGVNTNQFKPLNLSRKNIVMSVGSADSRKGTDFIIKALGNVDKEIRPKFLIVGYGRTQSYIDYLYDLADQLDVDFEIVNNVSYENLIKLYNEVKIVLFTPYLEPFGLVPLEAFTCGTPVIGVKEGGVKETVKHMENGLLLDRDEIMFTEGITELLVNQDLWNQFSEYGPKYVNEFWTLDDAGERLLNHFYRILEEKNKN